MSSSWIAQDHNNFTQEVNNRYVQIYLSDDTENPWCWYVCKYEKTPGDFWEPLPEELCRTLEEAKIVGEKFLKLTDCFCLMFYRNHRPGCPNAES